MLILSILLLITLFNLYIGVYIENPSFQSKFIIGDGYYIDNVIYNSTLIQEVLFECFNDIHTIANIYLLFESRRNMNLIEIANISSRSEYYFQISHTINGCTVNKSKHIKLLLWHISLALWPWNSYSIWNIGYVLEWDGCIGVVLDMYSQVLDQQSHRLLILIVI
jgi:hypothetical protein